MQLFFRSFFGVKTSYTHLKPFGCLAHVNVFKVNRDKIEPRSVSCVFLGYPFGKKAYKFLNLKKTIIFLFSEMQSFKSVFFLSSNTPIPHSYYCLYLILFLINPQLLLLMFQIIHLLLMLQITQLLLMFWLVLHLSS